MDNTITVSLVTMQCLPVTSFSLSPSVFFLPHLHTFLSSHLSSYCDLGSVFTYNQKMCTVSIHLCLYIYESLYVITFRLNVVFTTCPLDGNLVWLMYVLNCLSMHVFCCGGFVCVWFCQRPACVSTLLTQPLNRLTLITLCKKKSMIFVSLSFWKDAMCVPTGEEINLSYSPTHSRLCNYL